MTMTKRMRVSFLLSVVALLLIPCLSGCGGTGPSTPQKGKIPVRGGAWIDDFYEEPTSLIPNAGSTLGTWKSWMPYTLPSSMGNLATTSLTHI